MSAFALDRFIPLSSTESDRRTQKYNSFDMLSRLGGSPSGRRLTMILGLTVALFGCDQSDPQAVGMTEEWADAAIAGDLEQAERLTYGEAGEPVALNGLARSLIAYGDEYGPPVVEVDEHHEIADLEVVCLRFDYQDFAVDGGMVLRTWPEEGLKLWEYRTGHSSCVDGEPRVTTTLPEVRTSP